MGRRKQRRLSNDYYNYKKINGGKNMVNIGRHEVPQWQYSSAAGVTAEDIFTIGTANTNLRKIRITDIIVTGTDAERTIKFYPENTSIQPIDLTIGSGQNLTHTFTLPYEMDVTASTQVTRSIVASASATGCKYIICGYLEK